MTDVAEMGWPSTAERRWDIEKTDSEETDICFKRIFKGYYSGKWQIPTYFYIDLAIARALFRHTLFQYNVPVGVFQLTFTQYIPLSLMNCTL
jgi:hypothetical protein